MKIMMLLQDVHRDNLSQKLQVRDLGSSTDNDKSEATEFCDIDDVTRDDVTQYESFAYWKPILPEIDGELEMLCDVVKKVIILEEATVEEDEDLDEEPLEESSDDFNEFNFWRMPIQSLALEAGV